MKPWIINILIIAAALGIIFYAPSSITRFLPLVVLASAVWVYLDARKLNIRKYKKTSLSPSTTPLGAAFIVAILWIIAFPLYISFRNRVITGRVPLKDQTTT